ncbi:MAG: ABC transporter permease subunit [Bacteroidetes bacterium]|nr:ABC transporter permease subunit [Bacteroidota bacterium]
MNKIIKYAIVDILRSKLVLFYTLFLFLISMGVFELDDNVSKGLLSLLNLILFIVPLVSIIFTTIYLYNSNEFIELLVSQPIKRRTIWLSLFLGISGSLIFSFLVGAGIPILVYNQNPTGYTMVLAGCLLTVGFVSMAFLAAVLTRDKAKGIGIAIFLWLYFAVLFDGLVLFLLFQFADYPLEKAMVIVSSINPIDLSRILILLQMDISALMGYTGAVFKVFFGTPIGLLVAFLLLTLWSIIPFVISLKKFRHKDL